MYAGIYEEGIFYTGQGEQLMMRPCITRILCFVGFTEYSFYFFRIQRTLKPLNSNYALGMVEV